MSLFCLPAFGRVIQKPILSLSLALLFLGHPLQAAEYFTGRVWNDLNKNGIEDAGEPSVQGVTVRVGTINYTTNSSGVWTSNDLSRWTNYSVTFSNLPSGYVFTLQNQGGDDTIDSDPDPATGVTASYNAGRDKTTYNIDAGIYLQVVEMDVKGNGLSILDGDVSPSVNDNTFFGSADIISGTIVKTFTIYNTGDGTLNLIGSPLVVISGTHAADFTVTSLPSSTVSPSGGTTTFSITFNPSAAGSRTAAISIANNDTDEDPYNFNIQGTGTEIPEIDVQGNGYSITDGDASPSALDHTDFGQADIYGGAHAGIFTITNSGSGPLSLTGSPLVQVSGAHAGDFTVSQQPGSSTVAALGGTQTFHLTFDPTTTGLRQATVSISSTDGDENPYTFAVQGTGTINPEIDIKGNNLTIVSNDLTPTTADSTNFGSVQVGTSTRVVTFQIYNTGPATLNLTGSWPLVNIGGAHAADFDVYSAPAGSIAPGGNTSFKISFDPLTAGTRTAILTIANNDLNEGSYTFAIQGTGTYATAPLSEIDIQVSLVSIPSGTSAPSFGSVPVNGGSSSKTFTIKNTGTEDLLVTASPQASISGSHASDFTVTQQPSSPVAPGASVQFVIVFTPTAGGTRSAYVSIENNDADESPYTITIQGTGLTAPEIQIKGNNLEIASGDNTPSLTDSTYYGNVTASLGHKFVTYRIYNVGSTTLTLSGVTPVAITGAAASEFSVTTQPSSSIAAGSNSTFVVKFDPSQVGLRTAAISITSDDADENPYLFAIQGNGTGPGSPLACVPNFFHIFGDNGVITYLDATTSPYTYTTIATAGYHINGMGYNLEDGLLYGFEQDANVAGDKIIRIDGTGAITVLSSVTIPFLSWRADFNDTGNMYFWNSTGNQVGIFDASTGTVTTQNTTGATWLPIDMAYLDDDGNFYGIQTTSLYKYNPSTHVVTTSNITGRLADEYATGANSAYYGACWSANDGYLYSTNSQSGRMYKINVGTGESVYVGQGQANLNKSDGASCPLASAPLPTTGTIGNLVWVDSDGDGIQDAAEVGLPGVTVSLYSSDDTFIGSTVTDASGIYSFTNLAPSDFYLQFSGAPAGFSLTLQDQGTNNTLDSDANPATGKTADFFVSVGLIDDGLDAGYTATGFGDFVWNDLNYNGVQDVGEIGVPGVTVQVLLASNNSVVATKTTDASGAYLFTGLSATGYKLKISNLPGGYIITTQNAGGDDLKDSDVSASTGISETFTLVAGQFNSTVDAGIYQQTSPEINVKGNNVDIPDDDTTPTTTDHTDFGSVSAASGTVVRTFTIQNLSGTTSLTLNGTPIVAISGTHASDFAVTTQPNGTSIAAGASKTFQVTFDPSAMGVRNAVISISNNDNNENPYDFSIQGSGLAPEIQMKGNNINIVDGDITPATADGTDLGSADVASGQNAKTFKIFNVGNSVLTLTGSSPYVVFSGTHAADFTVTAIPVASIAVGDSTFLTVRFDPSGIGLRTASLSIANNDVDENPFNINLQGTGTAYPEMQVEGNAQIIVDGDITPSTADHTDFGSLDIFTGSLTRTYTIRNLGSGDLALTGLPIVTISGTNAGDFIVNSQPASGSVAASGTLTFQVSFDPTTTGLRKAIINIANDDSDEDPYNFSVEGLGTSTLDQEIELLGNGLVILSGDISPQTADNTDMGTGMISSVPITKTFVIRNIGYAVLNLTGPPPYVSLTGTHASEFSITSSPATAVGIDSATTSFVVSFNPAGLGTRSATVNISNNDADENPYTFSILGSGIYNPNSLSEIDVQGNFLSIPDGDSSPRVTDGTDFGSVEVVGGYTSVHSFVIRNFGTEDLVLGNTPKVTISGSHAVDFSVTTQPASPVAAGSSVSLSITFNPSATGLRTATITIGNSDQNENPYDFSIQGTGTTAPEIGLSGNGVTISNGDNSPSMGDSTYFGDVDVNLGTTFITYTIHNTGSSTLNLTGSPLVNIIGDHASDYAVSSQPSASISSGSSSSFVVAFNPAIVGLRDAAISITSNDAGASPYLFAIRGNGTGPGSPLACVPNFFHVYGSNGVIAYLDATVNPYVYTTIATAGFELNGMGYNLEDGLLYGFNMSNGDLIRIDGQGTVTTLTGVNSNYESWRADFNDSGDMYFWNSTGNEVGIFDASAGSISYHSTTGQTWNPIDMAYLDSDGNFYGVHDSTLYKLDPGSYVVSKYPLSGRLVDDLATVNSIYFGAAWSANDGYLYTTNSQSGRMYKINVDSYETIYVGQGEANLSSSDGASCPLAAAPLPSTGTLGDYVWLDADDDGIQDAEESGLANITVSLYGLDDTFIASVLTASDGSYAFTNLSPSEYYLTFTNPPSGFGLTAKDQGGNDALDSDADPTSHKTPLFTVNIGSIDNNWDAGFKATGVGDFVWLDTDEDGVQDAGEVGVPGINVEIKLESTGTSMGTTTTDANGFYCIKGLTAGTYRLYFTNLPAGYAFSPQDQGGNDALDSDVNPGNGQTATFALTAGMFNARLDAGVYQQSEPEIDVKGNGVSIPDGDTTPATADHTDFGSVSAMVDSVVYTFHILNVSGTDLTLNGNPRVAISGTNAAEFVVGTQPATTILVGDSSAFTLRFIPEAEGLRSATVSIANTDANENPYTFDIRGFGLASEIQVSGNGLIILDGDSTSRVADYTDFGSQDISTGSQAYSFSILNTGNANLVLTDPAPHITISGDHAADFMVTTAPISPVASNESTTFTLTFDPMEEGVHTALVSIANNDLDEDPYTFVVSGTGTATPEIAVQGNGEFIADGDVTPINTDNTDFGSKDILSETKVHTFSIVNPGSGSLLLSGSPLVQLSGTHAGDFVVNQQPDSNAVAPDGGSLSFQLTFNPTSVGLRNAILSIASNDADENPFDFAIQGTGVASSDMDVLGNGLSIANGDLTPSVLDSTVFDSTIVDTSFAVTFTIRNNGSAILNLSGGSPYVTISGDQASDFAVTSIPSGTVAAGGGETPFTITFTPSAEGLRTASVSIASDDADDNPYTFSIKGVGLPTPQPTLTLTETVDQAVAAPGDTLTYTVIYSNVGVGLATNVVVDEEIPENVTYLTNSAAGAGMVIVFSHDNGSTYTASQTAPVTHIRYQRTAALLPGANGTVSFKVTVD